MDVSMLPDGAWFQSVIRGEVAAVGQKLIGCADGDVRVRYTERWGKSVKETLWISAASPVRRIAEPRGDGPPDAVEAVAPEMSVAPQEEKVFDPFAD